MTVTILAKPRHDAVITELSKVGRSRLPIPDSDVAASILTCMPDSEVDVLIRYRQRAGRCRFLPQPLIRALDGDMQGRLLARHDVKAIPKKTVVLAGNELARLKEMASKLACCADEMARKR